MGALILPVGNKPLQVESGHWYDRSGRPAYEQATKAGGVRPTDLRDARKLGLLPSVTTVLSVLDKAALVDWKVKQAVLAALTLTRRPDESDDAFIARVVADSKEQAKAAAEEGTRVHDQIERSFKGEPVALKYALHVEAVHTEVARLFPGVTDWVSEESFAHPSGYGGKVDLHSPSTGIVIDFKGKDGDFSDGKRLAYDQHYQLAAYQRGLVLPFNRCANVFFSRTHPGAVASRVWSLEDVAEGWGVFESALMLWKRLKRYDGGFDQARAA